MNEFELINRYFKRSNTACVDNESTGNRVDVGIGDDCAVVNVAAGEQLALSIDTLVEGIHFPPNANPYDLAQRAFCVCMSDLAAMGAQPLWYTLALTLPEDDATWLDGFSQGMFSIADKYKCHLIGGNTTRGPLSISLQVHGSIPQGQAILRSGAKPGENIFVSGPLGDGAMGLAMIQHRVHVSEEARDYFYSRFYRPEPQVQLGMALRNVASAAIDISDGFLADLKHVCEASGVGAEIELGTLPNSQHRLAEHEFVENENLAGHWQQWMLSGGDDYQLCFTVPSDTDMRSDLLNTCHHVGKITQNPSVVCKLDGQIVEPKKFGYQHF